jgi:hypothetical protein
LQGNSSQKNKKTAEPLRGFELYPGPRSKAHISHREAATPGKIKKFGKKSRQAVFAGRQTVVSPELHDEKSLLAQA